jgi:hypothetical protein
MIAPEAGLSVSRQCTLLGVARSSFYHRPRPEAAEELELLKRLDRIFTDHPVYGSRRLKVALLREGVSVGRRRVRRLKRTIGRCAPAVRCGFWPMGIGQWQRRNGRVPPIFPPASATDHG